MDGNNEPITNLSKTVRVDFKKGKIEGTAFITKSFVPDNRETKQSQFHGIESAELVEVNGLDVFLFKQYKDYYIRYEDSTSQIDYNISLSKCDYKEAKRIAESIK